MSERWKPVIDYEDWYEVSDLSVIRRTKASCGTHIGKILIPHTNRGGYRCVSLCKEGGQRTATVHRIVTESFLGRRPGDKQVNHKDGDKTNNRLDNLEYVTPSENMLHAFSIGLISHRGEKNSNIKLTEKDVYKVRRLLAEGHTLSSIAFSFNVSKSCIGGISAGNNWAWLKEEEEEDDD